MITCQKAKGFKAQGTSQSQESLSDYLFFIAKRKLSKNYFQEESRNKPLESQKSTLPKGWEALADLKNTTLVHSKATSQLRSLKKITLEENLRE